jgi:hypothetical protein
MSGFIKINRQIWESTAFAHEVFSEREAWIWMISEASFADRRKRVGDLIVDLARGDLALSSRFAASSWGWTDSKVRRYLKRLEKLEMILAKTDAGVTVVSICNYSTYQGSDQASDAPPTHHRRTTDANYKKGERRMKEGKEEEAKASLPKQRASRLSPDWFLPKDWGEWAVSEGCSVDLIRSEADKFRDYWHSKAGASAAKLDWQATWRNWIRAAIERAPTSKQNGKRYDGFDHHRSAQGRGNGVDPALANILRLAGVEQTSGDDRGGTGGFGEEVRPFRLGS